MVSKSEAKREKEWEAEDAARTLVRAAEIKKDGKVLAAALRKLRQQREAIANALKGTKES